MKKKIMKKFADLAAKFGETNLSYLLIKGKKALENKDLLALVKTHGRVEVMRKTCFSTLPCVLTKVNKNRHL